MSRISRDSRPPGPWFSFGLTCAFTELYARFCCLQILKGGFIVAADLVRALEPVPRGLVVEFVAVRGQSSRRWQSAALGSLCAQEHA